MNLSVPHLSDEAVAAFADGMLGSSAAHRAQRHIADCRECAAAVAEQQAAVSALQSAPLPSLPAGLLDRLRAVPVTTPLTPSVLALAPDGSAVFPAYGTAAAFAPAIDTSHHYEFHRPDFHFPVAMPHMGRRAQQFALVAAAAAMFTVGVAASASADTASSGSTARPVPAGANSVQQVGFTSRKP